LTAAARLTNHDVDLGVALALVDFAAMSTVQSGRLDHVLDHGAIFGRVAVRSAAAGVVLARVGGRGMHPEMGVPLLVHGLCVRFDVLHDLLLRVFC
jgi:hypothetical protein